MRIFTGSTDAEGLRFAVISSRFNEAVCDRLLAGAVDCLQAHGAAPDAIRVYRVPGVFEIPALCRRLATGDEVDGVVTVGAILRGETVHFDILAHQVPAALLRVADDSGVPVTCGIVAAENPEQAFARAGSKMNNKGWEAALAAIEMATLCRATARSA